MTSPGNGTHRFEVHCSAAITDTIRQIHRRAWRQGRGNAVTRAFRQIIQRLALHPFQVGEPYYRLPGMRLQVRSCCVSPLVVHFAVSEDRYLVFIKAVRLLPGKET